MDLVALLLPLVGAALGRWTRLPPVVVGVLAGLPVAALVGIIAAAVVALGAFVGWLRRKHVERIV